MDSMTPGFSLQLIDTPTHAQVGVMSTVLHSRDESYANSFITRISA